MASLRKLPSFSEIVAQVASPSSAGAAAEAAPGGGARAVNAAGLVQIRLPLIDAQPQPPRTASARPSLARADWRGRRGELLRPTARRRQRRREWRRRPGRPEGRRVGVGALGVAQRAGGRRGGGGRASAARAPRKSSRPGARDAAPPRGASARRRTSPACTRCSLRDSGDAERERALLGSNGASQSSRSPTARGRRCEGSARRGGASSCFTATAGSAVQPAGWRSARAVGSGVVGRDARRRGEPRSRSAASTSTSTPRASRRSSRRSPRRR